MTRSQFWLLLAITTLLLASTQASAQRRCPFNTQAQIQVQIQWQRQMQMQQQMQTQQAQAANSMNWQRNANVNRQGGQGLVWQRQNTANLQRNSTNLMCRTPTVMQNRTATNTLVRTPTTMFICRSVPLPQRTATRSLTRTVSTQRVATNTLRRNVTDWHNRTATEWRNRTPIEWRNRTATEWRSRTATNLPQRTATRQLTRQVETHRPTVQLRVTMQNTCGNCHDCPQNRTTARLPQRTPLLTHQQRLPDPRMPWLPQQRQLIDRPIPRDQPRIDRPVQVNQPRIDPFVRLPNRPVPQQVARLQPPMRQTIFRLPMTQPLPILRPPLLTIERIGEVNRPTLEGLLADLPRRPLMNETTNQVPSKPRPTPTETAPPLPSLGGTITQLSPRLTETSTEDRPRVQPVQQTRLDPGAVVDPPSLPPLGKAYPLQRGLLPALSGKAVETTSVPTNNEGVEVALGAPPLPPLPDPAN